MNLDINIFVEFRLLFEIINNLYSFFITYKRFLCHIPKIKCLNAGFKVFKFQILFEFLIQFQ